MMQPHQIEISVGQTNSPDNKVIVDGVDITSVVKDFTLKGGAGTVTTLELHLIPTKVMITRATADVLKVVQEIPNTPKMLPKSPISAFWDRGVDMVPQTTGATQVMDARDLDYLQGMLGLPRPKLGRVLDVGCGTGRIAPYCDSYVGVDVSTHAVEYCLKRGLEAYTIQGPDDIVWVRAVKGEFDIITCMSVFTHIGSVERADYLYVFSKCTREVLVDILPGLEDAGDVSAWYTPIEDFEATVRKYGWKIAAVHGLTSADGFLHRYYYLKLGENGKATA